MSEKIVLIGAGGFGREVAWLIERINSQNSTWDLLGFVDDDETKKAEKYFGLPVLGNIEWLNNQPGKIFVVCCVGNPNVRQNIISRVKNHKFATLIDPSVLLSKAVNLGNGSIICAGTILTVDINVGNHVIINLDCTVGHDVIIDDFVTIYPSVNISGNVKLNNLVEIGTGSQVIQGITVGANTIIGAGSVVVKELPENCTAVGCPARPIKFRS